MAFRKLQSKLFECQQEELALRLTICAPSKSVEALFFFRCLLLGVAAGEAI
jgi:hypothetical protein